MDYVIIVAGGKGLRMGTDTPKQFLPLLDKPVLMRTIERFHAYDERMGIIVVLPQEQQAYWKALCERYAFRVPHQIANGGATRFESSRNGLALVADEEEGIVAFHDGVRPLVPVSVIEDCFETARDSFAAIPVIPVNDSLRRLEGEGGSHAVYRPDYRAVQTPQAFDISLAKQAFRQPYKDSFTDDATVVESLGCQVALVEGSRENIKITTPIDMLVAEAYLREGEASTQDCERE